jgi:hypothetical protein
LPGAKPSVFTAFVQPDRVHRGVVVAVALMRSSLLQAHLVAGTVQPIRSGSPAKIATADIPNLVSAFNSGFKMSPHPGGFYLNGKTTVPLVDGRASSDRRHRPPHRRVTTGMELDIHSGQQSFTAFTADPSGEHQPHKLMTTMSGPVDRYVSPDARDFFYFTRGAIPAN